MSESFRQQIAASGLGDSTALLDVAAKESKATAREISATLKPVTQDFRRVGATISMELAKLITASRQVQDHNARLIEQERQASWLWIVAAAVVVFVAGGFCRLLFEKGQTTSPPLKQPALPKTAKDLMRVENRPRFRRPLGFTGKGPKTFLNI